MKFRWLACLSLGLGSLWCGCQDGNGGNDPGTPFEVVATNPADGASGVQIEVAPSAELSAAVDPATLSTDTFQLAVFGGAEVAGSVSLGENNDTVVFEPDTPLEILTEYRVTVGVGLHDMDGNPLADDFGWNFTTLGSEWGRDETVSVGSTGNSDSPALAVDPAGNGLLVWRETDGPTTSIYASRFTRVDLWDDPTPLENVLAAAANPDVAVDAEGRGIAVWRQNVDDEGFVWASRFTPDGGWEAPVAISAGVDEAGANSSGPRVVIDGNGNALALWYQADLASVGVHVWSNRFTPESGWAGPENIDRVAPGFRRVSRVDLGFDSEGNALAVWIRRDDPTDTPDVMWSNRYSVTTGWGSPELVEIEDGDSVGALSVAVDPDGNAHLVWEQEDDVEVAHVWTNTATTTTPGWGTPTRLEDDENNPAVDPDVVVAADGVAHAVWSQGDGTLQNIWASEFTPGNGWSAPILIETPLDDPDDDGDATDPRLAIDADGNVFAVWQQFDGFRLNIWSNRFEPGEGWFTAEVIEAGLRGASGPVVAIDGDRHAHAAWTQLTEQQNEIRTNRFE